MELIDISVKAAKAAGEILKKGYGTSFDISNKEGRNNLVTEYDHLSEKIIIDIIRSEFPDHTYLAEESGKSGNDVEDSIRWIIDPLDGTVNFAHSIPVFSVSIAAEYKGEIICGVIYNPMLDELFTSEKGKGAFLNGKKLKVSGTKDLDSSILVTGFPYNVNENPDNCIDHFVTVISRGIPIRRLGSAALDLAYLAAGRFDAFWESSLKPWDVAAGYLIVEEAGGIVSGFDKSKYSIYGHTILASNGSIHDELSALLTMEPTG